jgi:hypothetical protein
MAFHSGDVVDFVDVVDGKSKIKMKIRSKSYPALPPRKRGGRAGALT